MTRPGKSDDQELMAFLDGELPPKEAREAERRIAGSPEARGKVEALGQLSDLLRTHYTQVADDAEPEMAAAWARLEAQLDAPEARPVRERAATPLPVAPSAWQRFVDWLSPSWSHLATGMIGAAAGALLVAGVWNRETVTITVEAPVIVRPPEVPTVAVAAAEDTQIEDLEATGNAMVFQVAGEDTNKPATTVIWVTDEGLPEGPI